MSVATLVCGDADVFGHVGGAVWPGRVQISKLYTLAQRSQLEHQSAGSVRVCQPFSTFRLSLFVLGGDVVLTGNHVPRPIISVMWPAYQLGRGGAGREVTG
ncbi:hypothetical protein E2C01_013294 [Portunus trituberculatus]|uniref:Uncharacterized protein n=1 Tax=Portunus trituberculatus TaxID=210409 RepID=A0A5B7DGJ6_PORTR|nr:hypothetical protein [Portunus trituberculatus]